MAIQDKNPRHLEPYFSHWMEKLTEQNLNSKGDIAIELAVLSKAIHDIAHWLSASLDEHGGSPSRVCKEYRDACDQIFLADNNGINNHFLNSV